MIENLSITTIGTALVVIIITVFIFLVQAYRNIKVFMFHACFTGKVLHIRRAANLCVQLTKEEMNKPVLGKFPILSLLLILYGENEDHSIRKQISMLAKLCIKRGANVNMKYNDGTALQEALKYKEISLSLSIAKHGAIITSADTLIKLYGTPLSCVYLSGLLLQARKMQDDDEELSSGLKDILSSCEDINVVSHLDLTVLSATYKELVESLNKNKSDARRCISIKLSSIVASLSEASGLIHERLLDNIQKSDDETQRSSSLWFVKTDYNKRNPLHTLGISGNLIILQQFVKLLSSSHQIWSSPFFANIRRGLAMRDDLGHTPLSYGVIRFKELPEYCETLNTLAKICSEIHDGSETPPAEPTPATPPAALLPSLSPSARSATADDAPHPLLVPLPPQATYPRSCHYLSEKEMRFKIESERSTTGGWDPPNPPTPPNWSPFLNTNQDNRGGVLEVFTGLPSADEFLNVYIAGGQPVIFRGAALDLEIRRTFAKDAFLKRHGHLVHTVGKIPYAGRFHEKEQRRTLSELVSPEVTGAGAGNGDKDQGEGAGYELVHDHGDQGEADRQSADTESGSGVPLYAFTSLGTADVEAEIASDAPPPEFLSSLGNGIAATQFYLGGPGSGAPSHYHGSALNVQAYGEKVTMVWRSMYDCFESCVPRPHT